MHTHLVATLAWVWRSGAKGPEGMLRRIASEKLILASTGGADWLEGSGKLARVNGEWTITGRKIFCSGVPGADVLMTMGIYDDPKDGPTIVHFPVSLKAKGVSILDTWKVLGMRGTGSHDVELDSVVLPDTEMLGVRRPAGKWSPWMHIITLVAVPVLYSAYIGLIGTVRATALEMASSKKKDPLVVQAVGEMETDVVAAQLAHQSMVDLPTMRQPGPQTSADMLCRVTLLSAAVRRTVQRAMEIAGGAGFYRSKPLERLFRDAQAVAYHPLREKPQARFTGRVLLGLSPDGE
jgi:acyl-CoA dehydrogenase